MQNIKVIVAYHKKDRLFRNPILFPLHLGRDLALERHKDGKMSQEDFEWLIESMPGDNSGENISSKNRYLNEMTGIYWAWKNYDKLGNPEYIGLNHYRRYFKLNYSNLDKNLQKYDFVCLSKPAFSEGVLKEWPLCARINNLDINEFDKLCTIYQNMYNDDYATFMEYVQGKNAGGLMNLFIMPKDKFFEYCNWIFPLLFKLEEEVSKDNRGIGMIAERLTSYYLWKLEKQGMKPLKASISYAPPSLSLGYLVSQFFSVKKRIKTNGQEHCEITLCGLKLNIKLKEAKIV